VDLDALVALMPFAAELGLTLEAASADRVVARLDWAPRLCTAGGALVAFLGLPEGATTATASSSTQLMRPVTGGTVRAVAVPLHRGRTTVTAQTSVLDDHERLVAQTTQVQTVRNP
jgi:acyl-coenzyme A thioesterase PaaI-like protein